MNWDAQFADQQVIWQYNGHGPHAQYTLSKNHSNFYFNTDVISNCPVLLDEVCKDLLFIINKKIKKRPDWVVTYAPFGVALGTRLAYLLDSSFAVMRSPDFGEIIANIKEGDTVLCCADDLYTGDSLRKLLLAVDHKKAIILEPLVVIANFSGSSFFEKHEVISLIKKDISLWMENECPLCKEGSPALPARQNWQIFIQERVNH